MTLSHGTDIHLIRHAHTSTMRTNPMIFSDISYGVVT
jgi:hypothetical protein